MLATCTVLEYLFFSVDTKGLFSFSAATIVRERDSSEKKRLKSYKNSCAPAVLLVRSGEIKKINYLSL